MNADRDIDNHSEDMDVTDNEENEMNPSNKRLKLQSNQIRRFTEPSYPMFQNQYVVNVMDEFGIRNDDLKFVDIVPSYLLGK